MLVNLSFPTFSAEEMLSKVDTLRKSNKEGERNRRMVSREEEEGGGEKERGMVSGREGGGWWRATGE